MGDEDFYAGFFPLGYNNTALPDSDLPPDCAERYFILATLIQSIQDAQWLWDARNRDRTPSQEASYQEDLELHRSFLVSEWFFDICEALDLSPFKWSCMIMDILNGTSHIDPVKIALLSKPSPISEETPNPRGFGIPRLQQYSYRRKSNGQEQEGKRCCSERGNLFKGAAS